MELSRMALDWSKATVSMKFSLSRSMLLMPAMIRFISSSLLSVFFTTLASSTIGFSALAPFFPLPAIQIYYIQLKLEQVGGGRGREGRVDKQKCSESPSQKGVDVGLDVDGRRRAGVGVLFEVGDVSETLDCGHVAGLDLLLEEVVPAEAIEPSVFLNVIHTVLEVSISLGQVSHEQVLDQRLGVLVKGGREGDLSPQDIFVDAHGIVVVEGVDSRMHLVDQHSQRPPVHSLPVSLVEDDFRSDVLGGAADGEGPALGEELGKAEVSEFQVAVVADQQILGFEISEDDVFGLQVLEARGDSCGVEAGLVGGEGLDITEVGEEFPSIDEFKDEIEMLGILSESLEVDDEGVADL